MGDQQVTKADFDGLAATMKTLADQMAALSTTTTAQITTLTAKIDNINISNRNNNIRNNNNRKYNNRNNQNRGGEPIRVRGENNRIIEDSSSSTVEKNDFDEIMSNHWKKLQILREQVNSAKSIEKDQALKSEISSVVQTVVKLAVKAEIAAPAESAAPRRRGEEKISTLVAKTGVEKPVPPSKASEVPLDTKLVKEYSLISDYRLAAITFYEEVTDQNLDLWHDTPAFLPDALRHYYYQYLSST